MTTPHIPEGSPPEERRRGPDPSLLAAELKAVRQDLGRLAVNVATLGSDDRLQQAVDSVAEESTRHWQRIMVTIIVGLLVVASLAGVAIKFSGSAKDAAEKAEAAAVDSAKVSSYVEHCLVHPDKATPGECGNTAATGQQSATILALFCYLQLPEPQRTDATAQECFTKAATLARAQAAAATTTTTTR